MNRFVILLVLAISLTTALLGGSFIGHALAADNPMDLKFDTTELDPKAAGALAGMFMAIMAVVVIIALGIAIVVILLLSGCLKVIPQEYREMEPGMVWLMLIPFFNLVWVFFVTKRIPRSFQRYFAAKGRTEFGDCGESIGLWYSICVVCGLVPCLNYIAGPAGLVLLIIFLVKVLGLKKFVTA